MTTMTAGGMIYGLEKIRSRRESYTVVAHDVVENADVCVIGSGAAGAIIASKLAQEGKSVVLIEKGGYYDAEDMNQREIEMIPLLWKNGGATFTDNLRMLVVQGQCLGGSTVINDAVCFRTPQVTREQWRAMGANIPDEKWDAAIDEVWEAIHASKVKDFELNDNNRMLKRACEAKGYKAGNNDRNCRDCMQCGMCHIGCHYETKQDMLVTYIRKSVRETGIRIYCNCSAERVTYRDGVADGVEGDFVDRATGHAKFKIRVNAKAVVVSAGTVASSQILLKNAIAPDRAGTGLTFHPASFLLGRFQKAINAYDGIPMAYTCHEFGVTNGVRDGGFLIESIFLPILQFSLGVPSFYESHSLLMDDFVNYTMAGVMVRDEPAGTVSLTAASGNTKVHYEPTPRVIQDFAKGLRVLAEMWFDAGAVEVIGGHRDFFRLSSKADIDRLIHAVEANPAGLQLASAHPQGGNRMGDNPATCVVDSNCRVHGFSNLFVCDASVFPTAVGVNPQVTVMALATMTAGHIGKNWKSLSKAPLSASEGECCSLAQPMYCSAARLEAMFAREKNRMPIETLINAADEEPSPCSWSFDKDSLVICNDNHWKGFFPVDQDLATTSIKYFGGFWKRFFKDKDGKLAGITHPYDAPVFADNVPELFDHPRYGKVVHLKYTCAEFAMFYDLLKVVDKDTILGKAFFGVPPEGQQMLVFCMSRKYGVDFMTEKDHEKIFSENGRAPAADEVMGRWTGKLVSDSALSPQVQTFTYAKDGSGTLQMHYVFGNLLSGVSRVSLTGEQMYMYDYTNWHDEVRIVTEDLMVGKWCSPAGQFPLDFGPSFLSVEQVPEGQRFCLRFVLRRQ